ncbi:MAG: HPr family phosphocarrier protein [Endozoicomonas sp. (ex Botrylloides leachii)]|nr:HPr family phosphocarrier protein [Endozoicomonas sp. (ex Botrylloides leachii)]
MIKEEVTIINKLGLHARAASKFVNVASGYVSQIQISFNNKTIDGKSIMAVMMLAAGKGSVLKLNIEGEDEQKACKAICKLIDNCFDEEE